MNAVQARKLVESQIGNNWETTNHHGVDLRLALVDPLQITVIERSVRKGQLHDRLLKVWLVLIEMPETRSAYRIVLNDEGTTFGLASEGFPEDKHLVLCGWYGDFMTTFHGM